MLPGAKDRQKVSPYVPFMQESLKMRLEVAVQAAAKFSCAGRSLRTVWGYPCGPQGPLLAKTVAMALRTVWLGPCGP